MNETARCILLAEDDRLLRKAAEATLKRQGFKVVLAVDGEEALQMARAERPDLIMPKRQGFEVLRELKGSPDTAGIPVIILSNLGQERDIQQAMDLGAVAYYVKANLSLDGLVKHVEAALERRRD
jgi:DNA-binding response OmpR family regulator